MTQGVYPRDEKFLENLRERQRWMTNNFIRGKRKSQEWKDNMAKSKVGGKNPQWKGDKVGYGGVHSWVKRRFPKPALCFECEEVPPRDLANISGEYHRDLSDWKWLCRRCHMKEDGRLIKFRENWKPQPRDRVKLVCQNCGKIFEVNKARVKLRKHCSLKCHAEVISKNRYFYGNQYINKKLERN